MGVRFYLWPKWAARIEQVSVTLPEHLFRVSAGLKHHPGRTCLSVCAHSTYDALQQLHQSKGWNFWLYLPRGLAVCFEFSIKRGLPRELTYKIDRDELWRLHEELKNADSTET